MLADALANVWRQTSADYEVIVVQRRRHRHGRCVSRDSHGLRRTLLLPVGNAPAARNHGIAQADGRLDSWMIRPPLHKMAGRTSRPASEPHRHRVGVLLHRDPLFRWTENC
jgi:hypothetical protein